MVRSRRFPIIEPGFGVYEIVSNACQSWKLRKAPFMPIHATAVVDPVSEIADTASIGPYAVIEGRVHVGAGTRIGPHVHLLGDTHIGRDCVVHSGAVIGDLPQDRTYRGGVSYCRIGDGTLIREHVTIHRGSAAESATTVGTRCLIMAGAHVGHNCTVGDEVVLVNGALLGGHSEIGFKALISGNVCIHQFVRVGELAIVGAGSKIVQDVVPYFMMDGPGHCVGINRVGMRRAGLQSSEIEDAKQAYQILCRRPGSLLTALEILRPVLRCGVGSRIMEFLSGPTRRGFHLLPSHRFGRNSDPTKLNCDD